MSNQAGFSSNSKLFTGVVNSSDAGTYLLNIAPLEKSLSSNQNVAGIAISTCFANLFGFKECTVIQPGSKVLCYLVRADFCYVIGIIPLGDFDVQDYPSRAMLGAGDSANDPANLQGYQQHINKTFLANMRRPTDVVDGEHVIANDYGVLIGMYQMMAHLKASELAQVQCHLLDDMVRIISHNFQHYTALGAFNVFHDGQSLHAEFGATSSPTEALGKPETDAPVFSSPFSSVDSSTKDDVTDFCNIDTNERVVAVERFKLFLGKLGDFFNLFITRPADGVVNDLQGTIPSTFDTGLLQQRMSTDGGYYLRSVKEIFLEKTNWIRVPQRIRTPEDPSGDDGTTLQFETKALYPENSEYQYKGNPYLSYLQLRNYVSYVNEKVAYQNFITQQKDIAVSTSQDTEVGLDAINNIDPNTPADLSQYALRTSGVYLMKNGGICLRDAWGSALVMEGGSIYLQPANDLVMQPLRNLIGKVGQFTNIASNQDIDFSSTSKGIRFKADQSIFAYSANSGIILQSDGTQAVAQTDPNTAVESIDGIVLKSNLGIFNFANQGINHITQTNFLVKATQGAYISGKTDVQVTSDGALFLSGSQSASLLSPSEVLVLSNGGCILGGASSTAIGQKGTYLGVDYQPRDPYDDPIKGALDIGSLFNPLNSALLQDSKLLQLASPFSTQSTIDNVKFNFLKSSDYGIIDPQSLAQLIPQTMAQQEDQLSSIYGLTAWQENEVNSTLPYPGKDLFSSIFATTDGPIPNLQVLSGQDYTGKPDSTNTPMAISMTTLNSYKVQPLI